jgi:hypothetical protein
VSELGAGIQGPRIGRISVKTLESKMLNLSQDGSLKEKAGELAGQMAKEDYREEIYRAIIEP